MENIMRRITSKKRPLIVFFFALTFLTLMVAFVSCSTGSKPAGGPAPKKSIIQLNSWMGGDSSGASSAIPERREFPVNKIYDPCVDFFQYACSVPVSHFKLREDRSRHVFAFDDSAERLLEKRKAYMTELEKGSPEGRFNGTLKTFYQACMNEETSKQEEVTTVKARSEKVLQIKDRGEFLDFLGSKIASGETSFMDIGAAANMDDPKKYDFILMSPLQTLPERSYYANAALVADWVVVLTDFFKELGLDHPKDRAQSVADFEKVFAQTYPLPAELNEIWNTRTQISKAELLKKFPNLRLKNVLAEVPNQTLIRDLAHKNFEWLNKSLGEMPLETLKNVYLAHDLPKYMDDAYPAFFKKAFQFSNKYLGGPNSRPPRQERCTVFVMHKFSREVDFELLPKVFPNFPKEKFVAFTEKLRKAIVHGLEKNQWLSPAGKKGAIAKMKKARLQLVKPDRDEDWDFNPELSYSPTQPYDNATRLQKALDQRIIQRLKKPRNLNLWEMNPLMVNAYYNPADNKFVLPIGILQYPFYDPNLPDHVNYGGIGGVIGHELGHGVDDQGSKYDSDGKFKQWLSKKDLEAFRQRTHRLVSDYDFAGINGKMTLGENIGDLVGVTFAYQAAFPLKRTATSEEKREFFLQWARNWCGVMRPKELERRLKVDYHSPFFARVNGQMKHQAAFAEAFSCQAGDPMSLPPSARVKIW